jgi:hypothetical protein
MRIWPGTCSLRISKRLALLVTSSVLLSFRASAREADRVLVIAPEGSRLQRLLVGEVQTLGLQPITLPETTTLRDDAVTSAHGTAVVLVKPYQQDLEIWVADRPNGGLVLREVVSVLGESNAEDLAVLHTGELLRANLIEVPAPPSPEPPTLAETAKPPPPAPPEPTSRFGLGLGPALVWGSRDMPLLPGLAAEMSAFPGKGYALGVWATWTLPEEKGSIDGSASLAARIFGLQVERAFSSAGRTWRGALGVSAAAEWLHARGQTHTPFVADSDDHWTGALLGRASVAYAPISHLNVAAGVDAGASADRTRLRVVGSDVAIWGPWLAVGSLRLEVTWP